VIISNCDTARIVRRASGKVKATDDLLLSLSLVDGAVKSDAAVEGAVVTSPAILLPNKTGLHVRPAAVLANVAKSFKSEIKVQKGERAANARSVTSLMALEVLGGEKIVLVAKDPTQKKQSTS
jgi:phosphocarrier protein FPr